MLRQPPALGLNDYVYAASSCSPFRLDAVRLHFEDDDGDDVSTVAKDSPPAGPPVRRLRFPPSPRANVDPMSDPRASTPSSVPRREDPPIDDRIVMPESRAEILHGELLWSMPAEPRHAAAHFDLAYVLHAHVAAGYRGGVDLLTRTGHDSDFAPDASIYPTHTEDEPRRLEELAFEITSEQALAVPTRKARELVRRGVRRVFAILVKQQRVMEWDRAIDGWSPLAHDALIEDRCLVKPLRARSLLEATAQDDEVARALLAKGNAVMAAALDAAASAARLATVRELARQTAHSLGVALDATREAQLATMDEPALRALHTRLLHTRSWD